MTDAAAPRLDLEFDEPERRLGLELFEADAVDVTENGSEGLWEAEVRHFKRRVWVWVRGRSGVYTHGCDCPHFEETGKGCEHLQALLLAVAPEADDADEELPELRPRYLVVADESEREGNLRIVLLDEQGAPMALTHEVWADIHDDTDVEAVRMLAPAAGGWQDVRRGGGFVRPRGPWSLPDGASTRIVEAVLRTGRACVAARSGAKPRNLAPGVGAALELRIVPEQAGDDVQLAAELVAADGTVTSLADTLLAVAGDEAWTVVAGVLAPVVHHGAHAWIRTLRRGAAVRLERERFLPLLARLEERQPLPRVADIEGPLPLVAVRPEGGAAAFKTGGRWHLDLEAVYDGFSVPWTQPGGMALDVARRRQCLRDAAAEDDLLRELLALDLDVDENVEGRVSVAESRAPHVFSKLVADGWLLRIDGRATRPATAAAFDIRSSGEDWFEIGGGLEVDGEAVPLASALAAVSEGRDWVEVSADSVALIPPAERARLLRLVPLLGIAGEGDGPLRVRSGAGLLAADLLKGEDARTDAGFEDRCARLESFQGMADVPLPASLRAELRPYQRAGARWLAFLDGLGLGGCLADEMGLGKTVQVIAEILRRNERGAHGPHLVVMPRSLVGNWGDELARFAPGAEVVVHRGGAVTAADGAVVLTTYGLLRNHADALARTGFDLVVLDEAQAIKNRASKTARAARGLVARGRVALSGTPIENRLEELWSLMEFLNPGLLGAPTRFASLARLDESAARATLRSALRPVLLRRTKGQVAADLPELLQQTVTCDLTPKQRALYDRTLASARKRTSEKAAPTAILEALLRLRQVACHAALVDREATGQSGKLEVLLERLEEARAGEKKALVFSQFTSLLDLIEPELTDRDIAFVRLDGSTRDREKPVARFQEDPACTVFLISLRAGGTGLNLTAADLVFILDPWWNPAVEAQAIGRAHRIGRTGVVTAQRLVGRDTIEEKIIALQERKRELADAIVAADAEGTGPITAEDLAALIG